MKLGTDIHHVSGNCWKMFWRSEVKGQSYNETKCTFVVETYISTVWRRRWLGYVTRLFYKLTWLR